MQFTQDFINKAFSYSSYRNLLDELLKENKTTGDDQSQDMLNYAKLNMQRMKRIDKTIQLTEDIKKTVSELLHKITWLVITEGWCGDASQIVPVLAKIAEEFPDKIELKLILRDENPEIMDNYLTNGTRSIPKVIFLDSNLNEITTWGPRPKKGQDIINNMKAMGYGYDYWKGELHTWYTFDKQKTIQAEMNEVLKSIKEKILV
jgi:thiol-disulfide isomerase/thioredoxin